MEYARLKVLAGATILLATLYFGLYPFNFFSRNDIAFITDTPGLQFHSNANRKGYSQQAIAYAKDLVTLPPNKPVTIAIEVIPSKIPNGLGTLIELHDGLNQPPLLITQWRNHLVIRSRRISSASGRAYQEIGLSDCLQLDKLTSLVINYNGSDTLIFRNGQLATTKRGYHLIDRDFALKAHLVIGNNATGERGWIGTVKRIAVFDKSVTPNEIDTASIDPIIEYVFDKPFSDQVPNAIGPSHPLRLPTRFEPLELKRFAALSTFNDQEDWQSSDITVNFLGFIPSSLVLFFAFRHLVRSCWLLPIYTATGAFSLSLLIEYSQIALPSRSPSYVDLVVNTLAGVTTGLTLSLIIWNRRRKRRSTRLALHFD